MADNVNTNIDDDCMVRLPFSSLTSNHQSFLPSEKGTEPRQTRSLEIDPARAHVNVKFDAELTRVGVQPGLV